MKILLLAVVALLGSVWLTHLVMQDPGYLFLSYGDWTVETSLAVALILLALAYLTLRFSIHLASRLLTAPARLRAWEHRTSKRRARRALLRGLMDLAEGNWQGAERNLMRFVSHAEMPLLNYLSAARAAQQLGAYERRDHYLTLAHQSMPVAEVAVGLTQAELQLAHQQYEQALATLTHLRRLAPRHTYVLRLLRTLYERLGDWQDLLGLLPELRRLRLGDTAELEDLQLKIQRGLLVQKASRGDTAALTAHWDSLPRSLRLRPAMVEVYSASLVERGELESAERLLHACLGECWSPALVERYGELALADPTKSSSINKAAHPKKNSAATNLSNTCGSGNTSTARQSPNSYANWAHRATGRANASPWTKACLPQSVKILCAYTKPACCTAT